MGGFVPYLAGTAAALLVWVFLQHSRKRTLPYPPGPKPLPIIGNLLDFPSEQEWLVFRQWNEQYGDVVYTEALGQRTVILGSANVVNDLLERKSAIYSDRPHFVMTHDLMDCHWHLSFLPYGERWRQARKLMHRHINVKATPTFHPVQTDAARRLVVDLLAAPREPSMLPLVARVNVGQTIIKIVYGIDVKGADSEFISLPARLLDLMKQSMMLGRFWVDLVPALRHIPAWMPGAGFQTFGQNAAKLNRRIRDMPVEVVKAGMADGTAESSMVRSMLEETPPHLGLGSGQKGREEEEAIDSGELIKDVAAVAYLAGSDTTVAAIESFFLAMLVYPNVQLKAQAEIDRVVGRERLPNMDDIASLPYVNAVVTECLRWLPVTPMGLPHMTTADDEYQGYLIPKGSIIIGSVWAIVHNVQDYPSPEVFDPERYVTRTQSGAYEPKTNAPNPRAAVFGFGRRGCSGRHIADASLFASIATALATMNVVRAKDAQGKEIVPKVAQSSGFLSHPMPFDYALEHRSAKSRALLAGVQKSAPKNE